MYSIPSSIQNKKRFLRWFIQKELSEENEVYWFIEDLLNDDQALSRIVFVEKIFTYPKGMVISTQPKDIPFLFFKGSVQSGDVYTAYHELQLYEDEPFYVQINFPSQNKHRLYQSLLREEKINKKKEQAIASQMLNYLLYKGKEERIIQQINIALDKNDKIMFMEYTKQLKELKKEEPLITAE